MLHHLIIFLALVGAILDGTKIFPTTAGRAIVLALALIGSIVAFIRFKGESRDQLIRSAAISLFGAFFTFVFSTRLGLGAVVASAIVGLMGAQLFKGRDQVVMYLGAFVGMSALARFPSYLPLIIAGLLGGLFFELADESWPGVGGRLGTIAAGAVVVVLAVTGPQAAGAFAGFELQALLITIAIAALWGFGGFWLRQHTQLTVVEVSALLALVAGIALPWIFPATGVFLATVCTAVSYAAMCSDARAGSYGDMVIISIICGIINYFGQSILAGVGGRLGTSAAISVLLYLTIKKVFTSGSSKGAAKA